MKINNKITGTVLTACLSLSMLASCGDQAATPGVSNQPTTVNSNVNSSGEFEASSLSTQAQAALASYHEVDASFHDSARLSTRGGFSTQQLGLDIIDDDNDNDSSSSTNSGLGVNVGANVDASGDNGDSNLNTGVSVGADVDASGDDGDSSLNTGVNVGANVDASGDDGDSSLNTGVNVGANVDASDDDGDSSLNTGVNVGANVDASGDDGDSSLNTGVNVGTNVDANSDDNNSSINTGTDINADVNTTFDEMRDSSNSLRSNIESTGSVSFDSNGDSIINDTQLQTNVNSMVDSESNNDVLTLDNVSFFDESNSNIDFDSRANAMTRISDSDLGRLEGRGFATTAGQLELRENSDGTTTSFFGTNFNGNGSDRNVIVANRTQGNASLGTDFMLRETGDGFNTEANRVSNLNADGSLSVMTRSMTTLDNGDRIEIFEERVTDINGEGSGNGVLRITDNNGRTESFDLRTMVRADGSLVTNLDTDDDSSSDLILREDAAGNASLSLIGDDRREESRLNLDFNAMLDAMSDFDFS